MACTSSAIWSGGRLSKAKVHTPTRPSALRRASWSSDISGAYPACCRPGPGLATEDHVCEHCGQARARRLGKGVEWEPTESVEFGLVGDEGLGSGRQFAKIREDARVRL